MWRSYANMCGDVFLFFSLTRFCEHDRFCALHEVLNEVT